LYEGAALCHVSHYEGYVGEGDGYAGEGDKYAGEGDSLEEISLAAISRDFGQMPPLAGPSQHGIPGGLNDNSLGADGPRFRCDQCDRSYKYPESLNAHKKKHLGLTVCFVCRKNLGTVGELNRHVKKYHAVPPHHL